VEKEEFSKVRSKLGKTQAQLAQLLGCSLKAVQSFEQGFRKVPVSVERQLLFLLGSMHSPDKKQECWEIMDCPLELKRACPAWEFQLGDLCWFVNGTICRGETQDNWQEKMKICRRCKVFHLLIPDFQP
jgi:hypothetical protein